MTLLSNEQKQQIISKIVKCPICKKMLAFSMFQPPMGGDHGEEEENKQDRLDYINKNRAHLASCCFPEYGPGLSRYDIAKMQV